MLPPSEPDPPDAAVQPARGKSRFAGDALRLVSGTAFGQILALCAMPVLSRLFAPNAFGVAAVFSSIVSIVGVVTCLRYELSIMLPKSDEEAANLFAVSVVALGLTTTLTIPVIWIFGGALVRWLHAPALTPYLWLIPVAIFVGGFFVVLTSWNTRTRHFTRLSTSQIINSAATNGTQGGAGLSGYTSGGGLIVTNIFGTGLAAFALARHTWRDNRKLFLQSIRWRTMRAGIMRYRKFPLYATGGALFNAASGQLPALMLQGFFTTTVVGYQALSARVLRAPMNLVGIAVGQVFFQRAAEAKREGVLRELVAQVFQRLVTFSLFPMFMMAIVGRNVFIVLFGSRWAEAGVYAQILSVWTFVLLVSWPLGTLFTVLEKQEFNLAIEAGVFVTRFLSLLLGGYLGNARLALALFAVSGIVIYGYLAYAALSASGVPMRRAGRILRHSFLVFVPAGVLSLLMVLAHQGDWPITIVSAGLVCLYFCCAALRDPEICAFLQGISTHPYNRPS